VIGVARRALMRALTMVLPPLFAVSAFIVGVPARAQPGPTQILNRVRVDTRKPIDFHAAIFPDTVYVGQQSTYQVAVYLNPEARSRLRRNPEFLPPELRGLLAYELGSPTRIAPQMMNGAIYEAHVFQRAMFPVAAGRAAVPAPQLTYAIPQSSSYFSREERTVVLAESAQLVVRAIPTEGRPADWAGAVGVLSAVSRLDSASARVGDPLVFTLRVEGIGNVKLLPRPILEVDWATNVAASERVRVDSGGPLVRGYKEFDWILTPTRDGRVSVPALPYQFFDPYKGQFAVAVAPTFSLSVRPGTMIKADDEERAALIPLRNTGAARADWWAFAWANAEPTRLALALLLFAPVPAAVMFLRRASQRRRALRTSAPVDSRQQLAQLQARTDLSEPRAVRRLFHAAVADRLQLPANSLTSQRHLMRALRRRGVTRATAARVTAFIEDIDAMTFASADVRSTSGRDSAELSRTAKALFDAVDGEAVRSGVALPPDRMSMFRAVIMLSLLCASATTVLQAQKPSSVPVFGARKGDSAAMATKAARDAETARASTEDTERRAVDAYEHRQFTQSSDQFAELVRRSPSDIDLLANWGTAAWSAGDTVHAVIGWQRAARLDPLDASLQEHLSLLPPSARGGLADVPLVPVPELAVGALATWILGWVCVAFIGRAKTHRTALRFTGIALLCLSLAAGAAAWYGRTLLSSEGLAVVVRPETLHIAQGSDADALGGVATGDVVRTLELRDEWQHIVHADGRNGWLPAQRLVSLLDSTSAR